MLSFISNSVHLKNQLGHPKKAFVYEISVKWEWGQFVSHK